MAISLVQTVKSNTATTTIAATGGSNTLVVCINSFASSGTTSITSVKLGTASLTQAVPKSLSSGGDYTSYIYYLSGIAAGQTSVAISGTNLGLTSGDGGVSIYEIAGLGALDKTNSGSSASGSTYSSGATGTLTQASEIVIGTANADTPSAPTGFTTVTDAGEAWISGYEIVSDTTSVTFSASGAAPWTACIASFEGLSPSSSSTLPVLAAPIAPGYISPANFTYEPLTDTGSAGIDQAGSTPAYEQGSSGEIFVPFQQPLPPGFISPANFTHNPLTDAGNSGLNQSAGPAVTEQGSSGFIPAPAPLVPPGFISPANFTLQPFLDVQATGLDQDAGPVISEQGASGFIPAPVPLVPPGFISPAAFTFQSFNDIGAEGLDQSQGPAVTDDGSSGYIPVPVPLVPPGLMSPASFPYKPFELETQPVVPVSVTGVTANISVSANAGSVSLGTENAVAPLSLYPPGRISPAVFSYQPFELQTDITGGPPVNITGVTASISITAWNGSVSSGTENYILPAPIPPGFISPASFIHIPQVSSTANDDAVSVTGLTCNILVTANPGSISLGNDNFISPALMPPGYLSPASFRTMPQIPVTVNDDSQVIYGSTSQITVSAGAGSIPVTLTGITANVSIAANAGSVATGNENFVPPALSPPGFISPAAFRHIPQVPVSANDDAISISGITAGIQVIANAGSIPATVTGVTSQVNVTANAGSTGAVIGGSVSQVTVTANAGSIPATVTGVTANISVTANAGSVIFPAVITGITVNISVTANPGSVVLPININGSTSGITVTANPGSVEFSIMGQTAKISVTANAGIAGGSVMTVSIPPVQWKARFSNMTHGRVLRTWSGNIR